MILFLAGIVNFLLFLMITKLVFAIFQGISVARNKKDLEKNMESDRRTEFIKSMEDPRSLDIVTDEYCNKKLPKEDAYIAVVDDEKHYFCSWECRQKYIARMEAE